MSADRHERWRTGGKNPYTVYWVADGERDEQHARDHFLGSFRREDDARRAVEAVNAAAGAPEPSETTCIPTNTGHLCFATARSDLRYLIQEALALEEAADDERLTSLHDVIEHAMETIRDQRMPDAADTEAEASDDKPPAIRFDTDRRTNQRFRHLRSGGTLRVHPGAHGAIELDLYDEDGIAFGGDDEVRELARALLTAIALPAVAPPREPLRVGDVVESAEDLERLLVGHVVVASNGNVGVVRAVSDGDGMRWTDHDPAPPPYRVIDGPTWGQDTAGGAS